jgi:hypothetical protein
MEITENKLRSIATPEELEKAAIAPGPVQAESPVATYDPTKRYRWANETKFYFSGPDFAVLINALRSVLSTKEAQTVLIAERASSIVEDALAKAVESGVAYEDKQVVKK